MKRFFAVLCSVAVACVVLAGCQNETPPEANNSQVEAMPQEDIPLGSLQKVEHAPEKIWRKVALKPEKQEFYTSENELLFTLENERDSRLFYDHYFDFALEVKREDGWYEIGVSGIRMPERVLPKRSQHEIAIYLEDWDYSFLSGRYRLVLLSQHGIWTAGEFDLVQDVPPTVDRTRIPSILRRDAYALDPEKRTDMVALSATQPVYSEKEGVSIQLTNNSDQTLGYGESDKFLSVQIDGNWYRIPMGGVNLLSLDLPAHTTTTISPFWNGPEQEYDFPPGHYRLELIFISHQKASDYLWTAVEFDLVE